MTAERTPDARVEAAARALYPYMWAENYWPPMTFGQTGTLAERVEEEREIVRTKVADALAAADAVQWEGLTERVRIAARAEWHRRVAEQVVAAPDEHADALAAAVVAAIYGKRP